MRTEKEIYDLVLNFAFQDERIRIVTLEGSRTNVNIPKDNLQDYDITFFVIDVGTEKGFNFSLGKNYKFLDKHISKELWDNLLNTYSMSSYEEMWKSFDLCLCLFKKISKKVADSLGYNYPDYDENVTKYLETQKRISNKYLYGNRY